MSTRMRPDEVKQIIKEAVKAVEEANVPDDLRVTAFEKSIEALIGAPDSGSDVAARDEGRLPVLAATSNGPSLEAVASRLGLDRGLVEEVYYVDENGLGLALAPSKFQSKKAAGTQQIALLLAAGRQAGGWEDWTPVGHIRTACRDYGRFDAANFATTIKRMGDVFGFRGRARQLEVRVTRPGYEQAADLARNLSAGAV
jgi:hypothetical protein